MESEDGNEQGAKSGEQEKKVSLHDEINIPPELEHPLNSKITALLIKVSLNINTVSLVNTARRDLNLLPLLCHDEILGSLHFESSRLYKLMHFMCDPP